MSPSFLLWCQYILIVSASRNIFCIPFLIFFHHHSCIPRGLWTSDLLKYSLSNNIWRYQQVVFNSFFTTYQSGLKIHNIEPFAGSSFSNSHPHFQYLILYVKHDSLSITSSSIMLHSLRTDILASSKIILLKKEVNFVTTNNALCNRSATAFIHPCGCESP